ncbi:MAG TPA: hypothetical protein PLZ57_10085 [Pseudobdellovibrionaceae bacterium]|nr:hypothetical protein [Pseudobdellovibrionaceae bacterium]
MSRPVQPPWWRPLQRLATEAKRRRLQQLGLKPNCLLTRDPIAFVHDDPLAFGFLPEFLHEHGYKVEFHRNLESLTTKAHIFMIAHDRKTSPATSSEASPNITTSSLTRLHLSWRSRLNDDLEFESRILDHAISLAEAEWK